MNSVNELYRMFKDGLEMTPGPEDHSFTDVWDLYADVTSMAGARLMEPRLGSSLEGAEEVRLYLARFDRVTKISDGMPVRIPEPSVRALRATGRLLEATTDIADLATFLKLAAPIANDFAGYAMTHLGRYASPIVDGLTVVARAGSLMSDQLPRAIALLAAQETP